MNRIWKHLKTWKENIFGQNKKTKGSFLWKYGRPKISHPSTNHSSTHRTWKKLVHRISKLSACVLAFLTFTIYISVFHKLKFVLLLGIIMWYSYLVLHILDVDFLRVFCFKLTKRKFFILYLILDKDWKKWSRKRTKKFSICVNKVNGFKCNWTMVM